MSPVRFGDLFRFIRNGMNVAQNKSGDGLPITRIETISDGTVDGSRVGYAGLLESGCRDWMLQPGDILFSHINSVEHIGKCAVYRGAPEKLVHGMNLLCLRCDPAKLDPDFAKYLIRGPFFRSRLANFINKAVNQASVSIGNLKTILVAVPPLSEQRRIAQVLDKADALRTSRRTALAQLDTLTQAIFLDMFGDPVRNSKRLPTVSLGELGDWQSGGTPPRKRADYFDGSVPWFSSGELTAMYVFQSREHISEQALRETSARTVPQDALMLGMYDTAALKASIAGVDCSCNQAIAFTTVNGQVAEAPFVYFAIVIGRDHFRRLQRGVRQKNLNLSMVREIRIPCPPPELQRDFGRRIAVVDKLRVSHHASLAQLDALFASLQHRAFRGELFQ